MAQDPIIKVGADTAEAERGLSGIGAQIVTLNQSVELMQTAISGLGSVFGTLKASLIDGNAQFEQYEASLTVMLGSVDAAKERLAELNDFASATPFELPEVVEAGNALQSLGRYSKETLTNLGDLAAGAGKPYEQAVAAFAKLASGQKGVAIDMFRDMNISLNDWVAATGKAAKANGEFSGSAEDMIAAIPKILEMKSLSGMMDVQSKTLNGLTGSLSDAFAGIMREAGEPFFRLTKMLAEGIGWFLEAIGPFRSVLAPAVGLVVVGTAALTAYSAATSLSVVKTIALAMAENAKAVAQKAGVVVTAAMTAAQTAWNTIQSQGLIKTISMTAALVAQRVAQVAGTAITWAMTAAQWALNAAMSANPIGLIVLAVGALIAVIAAVLIWLNKKFDIWGKITRILSTVWEYIKIGIGLFLKFGNPIGLMITALTYLYEKFEIVRTVIDAVWSSIKAVGDAIATSASWVLEQLGIIGDEEVEQVKAKEEEKKEVAKKSFDELQKELEAASKKQLATIDLQEAKGQITKEKATMLRLQTEAKYWQDVKRLAEEHGQDSAEAELKAAQAEAELREERRKQAEAAAKAAKERMKARMKEESEFRKAEADNIRDAAEKARAQNKAELADLADKLRLKEVSQRVYDQQVIAANQKLADALKKISDDAEKERQERLTREVEAMREEYRRIADAAREAAAQEVEARERLADLRATLGDGDLERLENKYNRERELLERKLEWEEITEEEFQIQRAELAKQYEADRTEFILSSTDQLLGNLGKASEQFFGSQKAFAIGQALISTWTGAAKALEQGGPIMGPIMMAGVIAAGLANVAKIASTKPGDSGAGAGGGQSAGSAGAPSGVNVAAARVPVPQGQSAPQRITIEGQFGFEQGALYSQVKKDAVLATQSTF